MTNANSSRGRSAHYYRSLPIREWPETDQQTWEEACRPSFRLKPGGRASYLAPVSREDFVRRYGAFLGFLQRAGRFERNSAAAAQVTLSNVESYIVELKARVRSMTVWNCIYKLRRAAELLEPATDFSWLAEIEQDLALVAEPRSKLNRLVFAERLVEAGLTLIAEAQEYAKNDFERAKGIRNGLLIALLGCIPIRPKNYATLQIGYTFKKVHDSWWISLPSSSTKTHRADERRVPDWLNRAIDLYLNQSRPILLKSAAPTNALWISSRTGQRFTTKNLGTLISKITLQAVGVDVSPHLFRTAAATTAAIYGGNMPHLASGVLGHTDPRVTEKHYNRATSINAAKAYAAIVREYYGSDKVDEQPTPRASLGHV